MNYNKKCDDWIARNSVYKLKFKKNRVSYRSLFFLKIQFAMSFYVGTRARKAPCAPSSSTGSLYPISCGIPTYSVNLATSADSSRVGGIAEIATCVRY